MTADQLEQAALKLPLEQRTLLVQRVIASLDEEAGIERGWIEHVRRQLRELETAGVVAIPIERGLTATEKEAQLARLYARRRALDAFIEAWKASRSEESATRSDGRWRTWIVSVARRLPGRLGHPRDDSA